MTFFAFHSQSSLGAELEKNPPTEGRNLVEKAFFVLSSHHGLGPPPNWAEKHVDREKLLKIKAGLVNEDHPGIEAHGNFS